MKTKKDKTLKRIFKDLFNNYFIIMLTFLCFVLGAVLSTISPRLVGDCMTEIYNQLINKLALKEMMEFTIINKLLISLVIVYCINAIVDYIKNSLMVEICKKYIINLRNRINEKILQLPLKYFEDKSNGEILTLLINDIENINTNLYRVIREIFTDVLNIAGACIMMALISPKLIFINVIIIFISTTIINFILNKTEKFFIKKQENLSDMNSILEENYTARSTIQIFDKYEYVKEKFEIKNKELTNNTKKAEFWSSMAGTIVSLLENASIAVIGVISAVLNIVGEIEIGYIYTVISYTKTMTNPLKKLATIVREILEIIASSKRIYKFIDGEKKENFNANVPQNLKENILAQKIYFSYEKGKDVIKGVDAKIPVNKKIAIVGRTGGGKTTLAKLLMKIYDVNKGNIEFDKEDISNFNCDAYIKNFSVINQDINLFTDTIMENIKYGNSEMTDEEIIEISKKIGIDDIISNLENGYNTEITENSNISTGIKQLIVLMQNIISTASILVFDEATNMLDKKIEEKIESAIDYLCKKKTLIIIAHKLKTIQDADYIYVVDNGEIIEEGTHEQLIMNNNYYAKMYNN